MENSYDKGRVVYFFVIILSFISSLIIMFKGINSNIYTFLFLLPLIHGIIIFASQSLFTNITAHIARILIVSGFTIRNVVQPLFFALGGFEYFGRNAIRVHSETDLLKTILLMTFETIVLFAGACKFSKKFDNEIEYEAENNGFPEKRMPEFGSLYTVLIIAVLLVLVVAIIKVPSITTNYNSLWSTNADVLIGSSEKDIDNYTGGSINRLLYGFFGMFFNVMQILISVHLIQMMKKLFGSNIIAIILSYCVIGLNTLFVTDSNAFTVFVIMFLFVFMRSIFEEKRKLIDSIGIGMLIAVLGMMIFIRFVYWGTNSNTNLCALISSFLNSYIPGIGNVSGIWNVTTPNRIVTFCYDIYKSIPLQSIIKLPFSGARLVSYYNSSNGVGYQIIPFIANMFYYFGIFAPFVELIFVYWSLKSEKNMQLTDNYIYYVAYITIAVMFGIGCSMYSLTNILSKLWKIILPCMIFGWSSSVYIKLR